MAAPQYPQYPYARSEVRGSIASRTVCCARPDRTAGLGGPAFHSHVARGRPPHVRARSARPRAIGVGNCPDSRTRNSPIPSVATSVSASGPSPPPWRQPAGLPATLSVFVLTAAVARRLNTRFFTCGELACDLAAVRTRGRTAGTNRRARAHDGPTGDPHQSTERLEDGLGGTRREHHVRREHSEYLAPDPEGPSLVPAVDVCPGRQLRRARQTMRRQPVLATKLSL